MKIAILVEERELSQYVSHLQQVSHFLRQDHSLAPESKQSALDCHNEVTNFIDGLRTALDGKFNQVELRRYK